MRAYLTRNRAIIQYPRDDTVIVEVSSDGCVRHFEKRIGIYGWNHDNYADAVDGMLDITFPEDVLFPITDIEVKDISKETKEYYDNNKFIIYAAPDLRYFSWRAKCGYDQIHIHATTFFHSDKCGIYNVDFILIVDNDIYLRHKNGFINAAGKLITDFDKKSIWGAELSNSKYDIRTIN